MDTLKAIVIEFRDVFLLKFMECSKAYEDKLDIRNIASSSIDLIFYRDLLDTVPEDTMFFVLDYHHFSFVVLTQFRTHDILEKEQSLELFDRLFLSVSETVKFQFVSVNLQYDLKLELLPLKTDFFFKDEKVVWMPFELQSTDGKVEVVLVFSSNDIVKMGTIKISA